MTKRYKVLAFGGDHIGPEVVEGADIMEIRENSGGSANMNEITDAVIDAISEIAAKA